MCHGQVLVPLLGPPQTDQATQLLPRCRGPRSVSSQLSSCLPETVSPQELRSALSVAFPDILTLLAHIIPPSFLRLDSRILSQCLPETHHSWRKRNKYFRAALFETLGRYRKWKCDVGPLSQSISCYKVAAKMLQKVAAETFQGHM